MVYLAKMAELALNRQNRQTADKTSIRWQRGPLESGDFGKNGEWQRGPLESGPLESGDFGENGVFGENGRNGAKSPKSSNCRQKFK